MNLKRLALWCTLSLFLFPSAAAAVQAPAGAPRPAETARAQELEKKAFALLDEVIAEAQALRLVENRIRIQTSAADLLWARDETRARALFREATDGLASLTSDGDSSDPQYQNRIQAASQLRFEMLQVAAQHDAKLALDFLRATRQPPPVQYDPGYKQPDQELMLEQNLANQILAQDPKQAIRLAEESLAKGITYNLINFLNQLREKDREAAAKLAADIIRKLRTEDLSIDHEAANVATNLLQMTRVSETPSGSAQPRNLELGVIPVTEQTRRELVEAIVSAAVGTPPNRMGNVQNLFMALQTVMPEVEKYAPTRTLALRRRTAEFERTLDPRARMWKEYESLMSSGTIEALIEAAPKAPAELRDQMYSNAAWKAVSQNEIERARQIIGNISNPQQRVQMQRDIDRQLPWRAAERGNFEEARQLIGRITTPDERVSMLVQLAMTAINKKDLKAARQIAEEAQNLVGSRPENQSQFSALLQIARAYASLDPARSFEIVEASIERLNELLAAAAALDGFGQESFQNGELKPQGGYMWNELIVRCAEELAALAPTDFERARSAAQRFQRSEVRTMVRLQMVQGVLAEQSAAGGEGDVQFVIGGRRRGAFRGRVMVGRRYR